MVPWQGIARTTLQSSTLYHLTNFESSSFNQFWQLNYFLKFRIAKTWERDRDQMGDFKNKPQCISGVLRLLKYYLWGKGEMEYVWAGGRPLTPVSGLGQLETVTSSTYPVRFSRVQNWTGKMGLGGTPNLPRVPQLVHHLRVNERRSLNLGSGAGSNICALHPV